VGEALVSTLESKGTPSIVQRVLIRPPSSRLGMAEEAAFETCCNAEGLRYKYAQTEDRESAYEILKDRAAQKAKQAEAEAAQQAQQKTTAPQKRSSNRQSVTEAAIKSIVRAMSSSLGRKIVNELMRGILGGLKRR
jgi:thymidylate synthase ThyX